MQFTSCSNTQNQKNGIRASQGAILHQCVEDTSQAVWQQSGKSKVKCHNCDKIGHIAKNCKEEAKSQASKSGGKCGFCGGPKLCKAKECKAIDSKCAGCNKFGHFKKCCNANTRAKARDSKDPKISQIDQTEDDIQTLVLIRLAERKVEKKSRQRELKANARKVEVVVENNEEVITINHINHLPGTAPQTARSIVWCNKVNRFVQKA